MQDGQSMTDKSEHSSRRTFLSHTGLVLGSVALAPAIASVGVPTTNPASPVAASVAAAPRGVGYLEQTGWNEFSPRFVHAPTLTWKPVEGAVAYIVQFANWDDSASRTVRLQEPTYN